MPVKLDHTVLTARDKAEAATFLAELLGLGTPVAAGHFLAVALDNGLTLDFCSVEERLHPPAAPRLRGERGRIRLCPRPRQGAQGAVLGRPPPDTSGDQRGNGRATDFADPSGHWLEVLTRN